MAFDPAEHGDQPAHARLVDLDRVPLGDGIEWRPLRRRFGITGFSANAYSGREVGDHVIEPHDEASPGSGRHEELYVVLSGAADFTVGEESIAAPAGSFVFVPPGVRREAVAAAPGTTVVVVGGRPGDALPVSPFEHWYAAQPAYDAGDYATATAIASAGLQDHPRHGSLHYQLACYAALAGDRAAALEHLRAAFEADPRTREWARDDHDLDALRDDPDYPA
jgi:mannose-6-phosphate isomerase-like protein (cupin superfamily)